MSLNEMMNRAKGLNRPENFSNTGREGLSTGRETFSSGIRDQPFEPAHSKSYYGYVGHYGPPNVRYNTPYPPSMWENPAGFSQNLRK